MRIAHVIPGLTHERGGPTTVVCALTRHQVEAGHAVRVLYTNQGARTGEKPIPLPAGVASARAAVWGPNRLALAPRFAGLVREHLRWCEILHVHSIFTHPVHIALREAWRAGVPTILRPCGHLHPYSLQRTRWLKFAYLTVWGDLVRSAVTCWHYTSAQEAEESWPKPGSPGFVLPNGIEPDDYALDRFEARVHVARAWPAIGAAPYALFLGRFHPKKRLDLLLEAFLAAAPPGCKLVVAGPDECGLWPPLARRWLGGTEAAERVVRIGTVGGRDKVALLAAARLFALPSEHENFGNAALEALATGTPVLLSQHVDLAGAALEDYCHRAALDVGVWADRLATLLANEPVAELAEAAGRAVCQRYSWQRLAAELTDRYRWVRAGCPAAVGAGA